MGLKKLSSVILCVNMCVSLQQSKAKYEIEAEKRELARLLEKRTQEVENLTGNISASHADIYIYIYIHLNKRCKSGCAAR